jgi:carbon monoxide dehydrogenase subunit G
MKIENVFAVPVPVTEAWNVLLDLPRVVPCLPGASLESSDGDEFVGKVKVKLGPVQLTYSGKGRFIERDEPAHRAVIEGAAKDKGGSTAKALITTTMSDNGDETTVRVVTDLTVTGKPAQFGRGVMQDVSAKLLNQFAANLSAQLTQERTGETSPEPAAAPTTGGQPSRQPTAASESSTAVPRSSQADALDLLETAGPALLKRLLPALAALIVAIALISVLRRRAR